VSAGFSQQVERHFHHGAAAYARHARLQQALAWRLVRAFHRLPLPPGATADLGAGSGAVAQALQVLAPELLERHPPLQVDLTAGLLAHNPLSQRQLLWNLNQGLPPQLQPAALLTSNFALQWLENPAAQLQCWCQGLAPGGVLALAVPTAGSFPEWRRAAEHSGVPCTALPLPKVEALIAVAGQALDLQFCQRLRFSRPQSGLMLLRQMRAIGADASPAPSLSGGQLRRLLRHWPSAAVSWEVLLLVGRRRP
jgi:malonyl-CoA O-methyltransferase